MKIRLSDIYRATLPSKSGNEGWIGLEPQGKTYHVIVPVDPQIARGVMACNRSTDGTPFGGYTGWAYFRCEPFNLAEDEFEEDIRLNAARHNAVRLTEFAASRGIDVTLTEDFIEKEKLELSGNTYPARYKDGKYTSPPLKSRDMGGPESLNCTGCSTSWKNISRLLSDSSVSFYRYRANTTDFRKGHFVFYHTCGGVIELPVAKLGRSKYVGRSLAGSHACPGFCYYETSLVECSAVCEGSVFRRIAGKLKTRRCRAD